MMSENERSEKDNAAKKTSAVVSAQTVGSIHEPPLTDDLPKVSEIYNRKIYIEPKAMANYKDKVYNGKKTITDTNGTVLHKSKNAAINKYKANNYTKHTSQTDHVYSAHEAHQYAVKHKLNVSDADIKAAINKDINFQEISQRNNQAKGDRSTGEFIKNNKELTSKQKLDMKVHEIKAETAVRSELQIKSVMNNLKETGTTTLNGFNSGAQAGAISGTIVSVGKNFSEVMNGDKDLGDAVVDVLTDASSLAIVGGGVGAVTEFGKCGINKLATKIPNMPLTKPIGDALKFVGTNVGYIATAAVQACDAISKYVNREIDEADLLMGIGDIGVGIGSAMIGTSIGATIGSVVPVIGNVVGGIIGGAICYLFSSNLYKKLGTVLLGSQSKVISQRAKKIYDQIGIKVKESREQLENYLNYLHNEMHVNITEGFEEMKQSLIGNDAEGAVVALKEICAQFGVKLQFSNKSEFDRFMQSDEAFTIG